MDSSLINKYLKNIDSVIEHGPFKDNWDSLKNIEVPQWYRDAKFGIFIHWGVYSVPAFANEWYPRGMYIKDSPEYKHHIKKYGKHKDFGYKDFIPMFTAEHFDAAQWMELFKDAGARYVMPVAEHHDGFQMYKSELSKWNAFEMGPKRDVIAELQAAAASAKIEFCLSSHRVEHWFFMGHGREFDSDIKDPIDRDDIYWPSMPEPDHMSLYPECPPSAEYMEDWLVRSCEIVDKFKPAVMYFDWWIQIAALKSYLKKFAAYYYNRMHEWGRVGAINYKHDAFIPGAAVQEVERGQFASIKPYFWQTCTPIANNSWCYTENNDYRDPADIISNLVDIVSKNGCLLLNVGPRADGSIADEDRKVLREIGNWLRVNGEAIYSTTTFKVFGEGPTKIKEGQFTDTKPREFTSRDIRFTQNGSVLYAAVLKYPEDGIVRIKSLKDGSAHFRGIIKDISVLGFDEKPEYKQDKNKLILRTKTVSSANPVVFRIIID